MPIQIMERINVSSVARRVIGPTSARLKEDRDETRCGIALQFAYMHESDVKGFPLTVYVRRRL